MFNNMYSIRRVKARQIFDSRGNPTIECELKTGFGRFMASVPSGASTGSKEAVELRDGEKEFNGLGVKNAIRNINEILSVAVQGLDCREQKKIDDILIKEDNTDNKSKLGANSLLAVSMACAKAGSIASKKELFQYVSDLSGRKPVLPVPALNIINGGKHAGNELDFQEYQLIPTKFKSFNEAFSAGVTVFHELKKNLQKDYGKNAINVGDEGGFAPQMNKVEEPLDEILKAIETTGYEKEIFLAMDVAASSFSKKQDDGKITYLVEGHTLTKEQLLIEYESLLDSYKIVSIEDPFDENDFDGWKQMCSKLGKRIQIVGDDLTVSQSKFIKKAIDQELANALLLKINQVGTITEAIESANLAFSNGWQVQVSHRSGETNEKFIADLAVGLGNGQIKSGAPCRGERLAKYNQLLKIEEDYSIPFIGKNAFSKMK
ncbi:MAG: phosphopyruvate hydratase [Candidatus ainarchaeum sp.]|nr:phosphopyruvate hydratase [Candidatus ainarchaeum sp.]